VIQVLKALADPDIDDVFKPASELFEGNGSLGNGAAMRIAPLGLFYHDKPWDKLKVGSLSTLTFNVCWVLHVC
jgi:poly(ADP-ribose) glycohydrolase ARH3